MNHNARYYYVEFTKEGPPVHERGPSSFDVPRTTLAQERVEPSDFEMPRSKLAEECVSPAPVSLLRDMIIELQELRADIVDLRSAFLLHLRVLQRAQAHQDSCSSDIVGPWDSVSQVARR